MSFWQRHDIESTSWKRIILWWELRRIPYNLGVVIFAFLLSFIQSFFTKGGGGGSPLMLLLMFFGAMILVNIFYTTGWILDLLFRKNRSPFVSLWRPRLFVLLLLITCSAMVIFKVIEVLYALSAGYLKFS